MSTYTPRNQWQGTPSDADGWVSCGAYAGAVCVDAASVGGCVPTGHQVRALSNEPVPQPGDPGLNLSQVINAVARMGCTLQDRTGQKRAAMWTDLSAGRYLSVSVWYPGLGPYMSQTPGEFGHQVTIGRLNTVTSKVMLFDPLNRSALGRWAPLDVIVKAAVEWGQRTGLAAGQMRYARTRVVPGIA